MAIKSSARGTRPVTLAAIHTAQGARTAAGLAAYFDRDDIKASSHDIIDASHTLHILSYDRAAWTLRSGNPISDNLEICGFAEWTRAEWLSTGTVDGCVNPRAMVRRTAAWVLARSRARGLPLRRLTHDQLRAGERGVIMHHDWTLAMRDGTHWDVGPGFPWPEMWADVQTMIGDTTMTTPAELWGYKNATVPASYGYDAFRLLYEARQFAQTAANAAENLPDDTARRVWGYDSPDAAAKGRDAIQLIVDAVKIAERLEVASARIEATLARIESGA